MPRQRTNTTTTRRAAAPAKKIAHAPKRREKGAELPATPTPVTRSEDEVLRELAEATPADLFQAEKRRRAGLREIADPLAEARREYQALLASEAGTPRGGRPRKARPKKDELSLEDSLEEFRGSSTEADEE